MKRVPSLVLTLVAACCPAQDTKPYSASTRPGTYDLRISSQPRALLVEMTFTAKGKVAVKAGGPEVVQTVDQKGKARWIDEVGDYRSEPVVDRRTYLEAQLTDNGLVKDPGLDGVALVFTTEKGTSRLDTKQTEGVGILLAPELQAQLRMVEALGLYLNLPKAAAVGERVPYRKSDGLLSTLVGSSGPISDVQGDLLFDRVDPKANRAFLSGTLGFTEEVAKDGATFAAKYQVTLSVEVDLGSHEVARVALSGRVTLSGLGKSEGALSGEVDYDSKATARPATDSAALKSRKAVFRENAHRALGIDFKLPSCWKLLPPDSETRTFFDSRLLASLQIQFMSVPGDHDAGSDDFLEGFTARMREDDPKAKVQKASFPIGRGVTFDLTMKELGAVRGCVVPVGSAAVLVRVFGELDLVRKVESEFRAMVNSMKKAKS